MYFVILPMSTALMLQSITNSAMHAQKRCPGCAENIGGGHGTGCAVAALENGLRNPVARDASEWALKTALSVSGTAPQPSKRGGFRPGAGRKPEAARKRPARKRSPKTARKRSPRKLLTAAPKK